MYVLFSAALTSYNMSDRLTIGELRNLPRCDDYPSCASSDRCGSGGRLDSNWSETSTVVPCYCDSHCLIHGDCCVDYFLTCLSINISQAACDDTVRLATLNTSLDQTTSVDQQLIEQTTVVKQKIMLEAKQCMVVTYDEVPYWVV